MDVTIQPATTRPEFDNDTNDLLDALLRAYGDNLPTAIERITDEGNHFDLHLNEHPDIGNAYGKVLATHGWTIIGVHSHKTDDDAVDTVSVKRIADCDSQDTVFYDYKAEDAVHFATS